MSKTNNEKTRRAIAESFYRFLINESLSNREKQIENKNTQCYSISNCDKRSQERGDAR